MNTHSKKWAVKEFFETPLTNKIDDTYYLYTLPTEFQKEDQIVILNKGITNYNLKCHMPNSVAYWRDKRCAQWCRQQLEKCRKMLIAVARNPHLFVKGLSKDGENKIKEELVKPSLEIKNEPDLTPKLEYPPPPVSPDCYGSTWISWGLWAQNTRSKMTSLTMIHQSEIVRERIR